jgi:hypothetical protein
MVNHLILINKLEMQGEKKKEDRIHAWGLNYFCKPAALNQLQLLHLEVFIYICGLKFRILSTSDFFSRS